MFGDWTVEVLAVVPNPNENLNPYTGDPIDPEGITQSLVKMRLTHKPTGKTLVRAELTGELSVDLLVNYARNVTANADTQLAYQGPQSPLVGFLDITEKPHVGPTPDDLAVRAFEGLVRDMLAAEAHLDVVQRGKGGQQELDAAQAAVDAANAAVKAAYSTASPTLAHRYDQSYASIRKPLL